MHDDSSRVTAHGGSHQNYGTMPNQYANGRLNREMNSPSSPQPGQQGYEEFFGGTVACPSCNGVGRIPREKENELVALIPLSDNRLKPRRTKCYVAIALVVCAVVAGLLMFFLFPRTIQLQSNVPNLQPDYLYVNTSQEVVFMTVTNVYNISNQNFFPVEVSSLAVTVTFDQKILATQTNKTAVNIPMRAKRLHAVQLNITFDGDEGYIALFCDASARYGHTLLMPFSATATLNYLGRSEESTLTTYQHVRCSEKKHKTTPSVLNVVNVVNLP